MICLLSWQHARLIQGVISWDSEFHQADVDCTNVQNTRQVSVKGWSLISPNLQHLARLFPAHSSTSALSAEGFFVVFDVLLGVMALQELWCACIYLLELDERPVRNYSSDLQVSPWNGTCHRGWWFQSTFLLNHYLHWTFGSLYGDLRGKSCSI